MNVKPRANGRYTTWNMAIGIAAACLVAGFLAGVYFGARPAAPGADKEPVSGPEAPAATAVMPPSNERILSLEKRVFDNPGDLDSWLELGNLYFDTGSPQSAVRAYRKYLDSRPDSPGVWTDLGVMYRQLSRFPEAVQAFDRALAIDPDHAPSRYNKGLVLLHDLKDMDKAMAEWRVLVEKHPEFTTPEGRSIRDIVRDR